MIITKCKTVVQLYISAYKFDSYPSSTIADTNCSWTLRVMFPDIFSDQGDIC